MNQSYSANMGNLNVMQSPMMQALPANILGQVNNTTPIKDRTANLTPDPARMEAMKRLLGGL